jgi:predicted XRE-type DNA-binding protein
MAKKSFKSVWNALEDTEELAANMKARAEVMIALQERIRSRSGTQAQRARELGITQPRLNDLLRGRVDKFSLDALVSLAARAGLRVDLSVKRAA